MATDRREFEDEIAAFRLAVADLSERRSRKPPSVGPPPTGGQEAVGSDVSPAMAGPAERVRRTGIWRRIGLLLLGTLVFLGSMVFPWG